MYQHVRHQRGNTVNVAQNSWREVLFRIDHTKQICHARCGRAFKTLVRANARDPYYGTSRSRSYHGYARAV